MNKLIVSGRKEYELLLEVRERGYSWLSLKDFKQREAELVKELNELKFEAGICFFVRALKRVDFPTLGSPTIPQESPVLDIINIPRL